MSNRMTHLASVAKLSIAFYVVAYTEEEFKGDRNLK